MANKEFSTVCQTIEFCNNIRKYWIYGLFFRQIKNVTISDTDCTYFLFLGVIFSKTGFSLLILTLHIYVVINIISMII